MSLTINGNFQPVSRGERIAAMTAVSAIAIFVVSQILKFNGITFNIYSLNDFNISYAEFSLLGVLPALFYSMSKDDTKLAVSIIGLIASGLLYDISVSPIFLASFATLSVLAAIEWKKRLCVVKKEVKASIANFGDCQVIDRIIKCRKNHGAAFDVSKCRSQKELEDLLKKFEKLTPKSFQDEASFKKDVLDFLFGNPKQGIEGLWKKAKNKEAALGNMLSLLYPAIPGSNFNHSYFNSQMLYEHLQKNYNYDHPDFECIIAVFPRVIREDFIEFQIKKMTEEIENKPFLALVHIIYQADEHPSKDFLSFDDVFSYIEKEHIAKNTSKTKEKLEKATGLRSQIQGKEPKDVIVLLKNRAIDIYQQIARDKIKQKTDTILSSSPHSSSSSS